MGLFSSSKKVTVFAASMPLVVAPRDMVKEATIYAILKGQSIPYTILDTAFIGGMSMKADSAYKYGYDEYSLGLPMGSMSSVRQLPNSIVEGALEEELGQQVAVLYNTLDPLTVDHAIEEFLINTRGYNYITNAVTIHPFTLVESESPLILHDSEYTQETHQVKLTYTHVYLWYTSLDEDPLEEVEYFYEYYNVPAGLVIGDMYCTVLYQLRDVNYNLLPERYYWLYRLSEGTYPILSRPTTEFDQTGFFPVIPIRRHNVDLTAGAARDTALYTTSKKLLKKLGLDIDSLAAQLNENPDIAEIDHAYVMMGVDIQTQVPESILYLTQFFEYLANNSRYTKTHFEVSLAGGKAASVNLLGQLILQKIPNANLPFAELDIKINIMFNYIEPTWVAGSIGPVGTVTSTTTILPQIQIPHYLYDQGDNHETRIIYTNIDNNSITFRWQVDAVSYRQIKVHGLVHTNEVYAGKVVGTNLENSLDPDDNKFIIPIHYGIAQLMPILKRNILYQDALCLQINSYVITKVKWYQTSFFKFVFYAVGVIVTVVTVGGATKFWVALGAAIADGAVAVFMLLMKVALQAYLIGLAVNYGMKFVAEYLGAEWAAIIGAAVAVYAITRGGKGGNLPIGTVASIPTSQALLQIGKSLITASQALIGEAFNDLYSDMVKWGDRVATQEEELAKATELLHSDTLITPLDWIATPRKLQFPHESPDAFFNRTIHTGNPGALTKDVIGKFYDNMLMLPKPNTLILT
jgi:hypothetical protein